MRLVSKGKPNHSSVSASLYRQGRVLLLQEKYDEALLQFSKALDICQLNELNRGNSGESARVMWYMAEIYEQKKKFDDAKAFRDAAEKTRASLQATGDYADVKDPEGSWDNLIGLLYR